MLLAPQYRKRFAPAVFLALPLLLPINCGRNGTHGSGAALPPGTFSVASPTCASTGKSPVYPDLSHKAILLDFEDLTSHSWSLHGSALTEILQSSTCKATIFRGVFANNGSRFALRQKRTATFEPEKCAFSLRVNDVEVEVSTQDGAPFTIDAGSMPEIPFTVTPVSGGFDLLSEASEAQSELWSTYGCPANDRLQVKLTGPTP